MNTPTSPVFDESAAAEAADRARRDAPVYNPLEEAETIRVLQGLPVYEPRRDVAPAVMEAVAAIDADDMAATTEALRALALSDHQPRRNVAHATMCAVRHLANNEPEPLFHLPSRVALLRAAAVAVLLLGATRMLVWSPKSEVRSPKSEVRSAKSEVQLADGAKSMAAREGGAWLLERQTPEGGWDEATLGDRPEFAPALTALGLLALHRQDPAANHAAVLRGAAALCAMQAADGSFGRGEALRLNQNLVSAVLLELNQELRSPLVGQAIARALDFSRRAAASGDGAWGYAGGAPRPRAAGLFGAPANGDAPLLAALREGLRDLPRLCPAVSDGGFPFYNACLAALDLG